MADVILNQIRSRLVELFKPEKLYLWGSRAKGVQSEDSDYDIVLIVKQSDLSMRERNIKAYEVLWGIDASVDVFVYTQSEFDQQKNIFDSVPEKIVTEGRELDLV